MILTQLDDPGERDRSDGTQCFRSKQILIRCYMLKAICKFPPFPTLAASVGLIAKPRSPHNTDKLEAQRLQNSVYSGIRGV